MIRLTDVQAFTKALFADSTKHLTVMPEEPHLNETDDRFVWDVIVGEFRPGDQDPLFVRLFMRGADVRRYAHDASSLAEKMPVVRLMRYLDKLEDDARQDERNKHASQIRAQLLEYDLHKSACIAVGEFLAWCGR